MNPSVFALTQQKLMGLLVGILMFSGFLSYFSLPTREDPVILVRQAIVRTQAPGLSAEQVENLVTRTLEEKLWEINEVESIHSMSQPELSIIHIEIEDQYFNLEQIWDEVQENVREATNDLPNGVLPPQVNDNFGDVAVVTAALSGNDYSMSELFEYAKYVRDHITPIPGTKKVELIGAHPERVYVEVSNSRLTELGISAEYLANQLSYQNVLSSQGTAAMDGRRLLIRPTGNFDSIEDIKEVLIRLPDAHQAVVLGDIAEVYRGYQEPISQLAYWNGQPSIVVSVSMNSDESVLDYGPVIANKLAELEQNLPIGLELSIMTYQASQVKKAVYGVTLNVLETLVIVLGVVILFLGVRTGLIVGTIVPAVMLVTLAIMGFVGMDLQRMSLATLVIALGLLVDNGIVVAEDFKTRLFQGASRDEALTAVGKELSLPLLSSTLTTILVFLPLMLANHGAGEYTRSISQVILISLFSSWVFSMTVTPVLCYHFIPLPSSGSNKPQSNLGDRVFKKINHIYEHSLQRILHKPGVFLGLMLALMAASVFGMQHIPKNFFPTSDREQLLIYVELEPDADIEATDSTVKEISTYLDDRSSFPHIESYASYVGFGGPRFVLALAPNDPAPNQGFFVVNVDTFPNVAETIRDLRRTLNSRIPQANIRVKKMFLGPSDSTKIDIEVKGPDPDVLFKTGKTLMDLLAQVPGAIDIRTNWEGRIPQLVVEVDQAKAKRVHATSADVSRALAQNLIGTQVSEMREGDDLVPIVLRGDIIERRDLSRIHSLPVDTQNGSVPLMQIANISIENGYGRIARDDLERTITVEGRSTILTAEDMVPHIQGGIDEINAQLPPGHRVLIAGVIEQSKEGQDALAENAPLCLALMVFLLVAQFRSYRKPAIIMGTIPLVIIGAFIGLYTMKATFGFMVILGLYALAGIIINNAIVLIDRIEIEREEHPDNPYQALINASVRRLRPIIMTTVTTVLGLLPLIILKDVLFYGLASAMAFGLMVATILTLGVVPAAYALIYRVKPSQGHIAHV